MIALELYCGNRDGAENAIKVVGGRLIAVYLEGKSQAVRTKLSKNIYVQPNRHLDG